MLIGLNFLNLTLFLLISFVAPYVSAKGASLAFSQNPEECSKSLEKEFFDDPSFKETITFSTDSLILLIHTFPAYLELKPQIIAEKLLRPPRFA